MSMGDWRPTTSPDTTTQQSYEWFLEIIDDCTPEIAARLALASSLNAIGNELVNFDHQLCMGIRHGLGGNMNDHNENVFDRLATAVEDIRSALQDD